MSYVLKDDHSEPLSDGSGRFKTLAKRGAAISWETARAWGLVDGEEKEDVKADTPKAKPGKTQSEETQAG